MFWPLSILPAHHLSVNVVNNNYYDFTVLTIYLDNSVHAIEPPASIQCPAFNVLPSPKPCCLFNARRLIGARRLNEEIQYSTFINTYNFIYRI